MSTKQVQPVVLGAKGMRPSQRPPAAGRGRVKGTPNKVTTEFRQTVQKLLDDNRENFGRWLQEVAAEDPGKAIALLSNLAEFAAPKLSRTEHTGEGGGPLRIVASGNEEKL